MLQLRARCGFLSMFLCFTILAVVGSPRAEAYPEFIGYGYSTCLTCHYNGLGSGPLTDYGRALWSGEIASRAFYPKSMADDEIAAQSGFLGKVELPYWVRPHIKYRGIEIDTSPGASGSKSSYYTMQTDMGVTVADKAQKYVGVFTLGRLTPYGAYGQGTSDFNRFFAREYYARIEVVKTIWVYAGLLEKAFGLRNIDHTSFQRTYQGFNVATDDPNGIAQSEGLIVQKEAEHWEVAANYFMGNPYDSPANKESGFSATGEADVGDNKRLGGSLLSSSSTNLKRQIAAVHYRQRVSQGSALMFEYGLIKATDASGTDAVGSYNMIQTLLRMTRGYNLKLTVERYNKEFRGTAPEDWKFSAGFLVFPLPRLELRLEGVNIRELSSANTSPDNWALEGQIHVSL